MTSGTHGELDILLAPASADDLLSIEALLTGSHLPTTDVAQHLGGFILARSEGQLVGTIAVERYGEVALLRSVCVESDAASRGIHHLYLLTTTAADYFARHGFETITRDQAPAAIQQTAEFRTLCPSSAVCMQKALSLDAS